MIKKIKSRISKSVIYAGNDIYINSDFGNDQSIKYESLISIIKSLDKYFKKTKKKSICSIRDGLDREEFEKKIKTYSISSKNIENVDTVIALYGDTLYFFISNLSIEEKKIYIRVKMILNADFKVEIDNGIDFNTVLDNKILEYNQNIQDRKNVTILELTLFMLFMCDLL